MALRDDLLADGGVERAVHVVEQQRECIAVAESADGQLGEPDEGILADARARRADERDPLGEETAGDEADDLPGGLVEPLRVVDDADQRLPLGDLGEQRQRGEPHQEPVGRRTGAQSEHRRERLALRGGQPLEVIQHGCAKLVQAAVGQLHLRLDANGRRDMPSRDTLGQVAQQNALARAGFSTKDGNSAPTGESVGQDPVKCLAFRTTSEKPHRRPPSGRAYTCSEIQASCAPAETRGSTRGSPWCDIAVEPRGSFLRQTRRRSH